MCVMSGLRMAGYGFAIIGRQPDATCYRIMKVE
ncbi:hypothetical protein GXY_10997 [Novacetimonas hansenii ATCC 23769]|uniref:Uncharacterized protein n=1 Tax=Novacetimonas hansenii ATCC 23769 TaxID=714995 RepID=D5QGC8_NOVHA|nr:hypothetical protein GXY_10997 [Novacetimonas hansenii ATCC 23769]